mgnify:CR=1 FL=1
MNQKERTQIKKALQDIDRCVNGFSGSFALVEAMDRLQKLLEADSQ